jgi:hypothetical protein
MSFRVRRRISDLVGSERWGLSSRFFPCSLLTIDAYIVHHSRAASSPTIPSSVPGVSFAAVWQTSSLTGIFVTSLLTSPKLPGLLSSTRKRLAASYQIVADALTETGLESIPATAGLWLNAKVSKMPSRRTLFRRLERRV